MEVTRDSRQNVIVKFGTRFIKSKSVEANLLFEILCEVKLATGVLRLMQASPQPEGFVNPPYICPDCHRKIEHGDCHDFKPCHQPKEAP